MQIWYSKSWKKWLLLCFGMGSGFVCNRAEAGIMQTATSCGMFLAARTTVHMISRKALHDIMPSPNSNSLAALKIMLTYGIDVAALLLLPRLLPNALWPESTPDIRTSLIRQVVVSLVSLFLCTGGALLIRKGNKVLRSDISIFSQQVRTFPTIFGGMTCSFFAHALMKIQVGPLPAQGMRLFFLGTTL